MSEQLVKHETHWTCIDVVLNSCGHLETISSESHLKLLAGLLVWLQVVYGDPELLKATLEEVALIVGQHLNDGNPEALTATWQWKVR